MSNQLLNSLISKTRGIFSRYPVIAAYLFGSQLTGQVGPLSDLDLAILLEKELSLDQLLSLVNDLKERLGKENIDLVVLNSASPVLKHQAVILGKRIFVTDLTKALEFERRVLWEYEDTAHLRKTQFYYLKNNYGQRSSQGKTG